MEYLERKILRLQAAMNKAFRDDPTDIIIPDDLQHLADLKKELQDVEIELIIKVNELEGIYLYGEDRPKNKFM